MDSGTAWISRTLLRRKTPALRACIANFATGEDEVTRLVTALEGALSPGDPC